MKLLLSILSFVFHFVLPAQSIGVRLGHSLTPADHVSLHYAHWTNGGVNPAATVYYERSRANGLNYSCYGLDLLGEVAGDRQNESLFGWRAGLGGTVQYESDSWVFKNISVLQRLNYGIAAEGSIECYLTEIFSIHLFAQQKFLFRTVLGSTRFAFGIGLTYTLPGL